jgi:hypothetical protein
MIETMEKDLMADTLAPTSRIDDLLAKARHAANIGDGPHTVLYAHEAVCAAVASLSEDIAALRRDLAGRS